MRLDELKVGAVFVVKNDPKGTEYEVLAHWGGSTSVVPANAIRETKTIVDSWGGERTFEYDAGKKTTFAPSTSVVPIEGER